MANQMKTPGVYIIEKNAFPNSVVEVATAVPAFIGYTCQAKDGTKDLKMVPTRITSMLEYEKYFGTAPDILFSIEGSTTPAPVEGSTDKLKKELNVLADTLKKATETFSDTEQSKEDLTKVLTETQEKVNKLFKTDAPTGSFETYKTDLNELSEDISVIQKVIEIVLDDNNEKPADIMQKAYNSTVQLQSRLFTQKEEKANTIHQEFMIDNDKFEVKITNPLHTLYYHLKFFYMNGGGPCYIVSIGDGQSPDTESFIQGLSTLKKEMEPTMIVIPEAVNFDTNNCKTIQEQMISECAVIQSRIAILDVPFVGPGSSSKIDQTINTFRNISTGVSPSYAAAYFPWLQTSILSEKNLSLDEINATSLSGDLKTLIENENSVMCHNILMQNWRPYKTLFNSILEKANTFPPSAAIAGIYTMVDNARGVWKAPANVNVNAVIKPVIDIDNDKQAELNVPMNGKAINAIRTFQGEGTKIWGARTLDGNSMDWRYINVRRTMIYLEQSIKNAARAYVFEPNTANTWINMKGMIDNFLRSVWKRGGLAGATPEDAYSIHIGLGDTMTPEDILDGILRITILVAVSHPAEFIEITFQQQMQKS